MKKFQYQFENILKQKEKLEDEAKEAFQKAVNQLNQYLSQLEGLENDLMNLFSRDKEKRLVVNINDLRQREVYREYLMSQIAVCRNNIAKAEQKVNFSRNNLTKARQEKEIFAKMKEKNYQAFLADLNYQEQKVVDELALYSFMRKKVQ